MNQQVKKLWRKIQDEHKTAQFLVLISFLVTFIITRLIVYLQFIGVIPNQMGDLHVHHLVPGIIILLISGYITISFWTKSWVRRFMAVFFGIGAALTIDEFALWVYLRDVYNEPEGRLSIDAVIVVVAILSLVYLFSSVTQHSFAKKCFKAISK